MKGLTEKGVRSIENLVKQQFNSFSLKFLGLIPEQSKQKSIIFKTSQNSILSLFLKALKTKNPNELEERSLKVLLRIASGYLDALKERTSARVVQDVNAYITNTSLKSETVSIKQVNKIISDEMSKAGKHLKLIANAESQKAVNTGTALQILKMARDIGEEDPSVFFVVTDDQVTGFYEYILHTLPDKKTPRVWKLSEIQTGYYKNGDQYPSLCGLHVNCRCKLTYLAKGFGFDESGYVKYKGKNHDEFKAQRDKYGIPGVPSKPKKKNGKWHYENL
jgi:hypothetical protein